MIRLALTNSVVVVVFLVGIDLIAFGDTIRNVGNAGNAGNAGKCAHCIIPGKPFPMSVQAAVEKAAHTPGCFGPSLTCNFFIGSIGKSLDIPFFRDVLEPDDPDHFVANKMYDFITRAVKSPASGWEEGPPDWAQSNADSGEFVIAVARSVDPSRPGHIALVVPSSWDHRADSGSGAWVRDGESPNVSWRASWRFGSAHVKPIYAVWTAHIAKLNGSPDRFK